MNKTFLKALIGVNVLVAILFAVAWYFSEKIIYPKYRCNVKDHYFCKDPSEVGLKFEKVSLTTSDNLKLRSWFIPKENSEKVVLFVHGHGVTIHEGLKYAKAMHQAGFNLMYIELRGNSAPHGIVPYTMGDLERLDVKSAIDYLSKDKNFTRIGIYGISMGAATSIGAMSEDQRIKAGIFNSAFKNFEQQITDVGKRDYSLPYIPLVWLSLRVAELRSGADYSNLNIKQKISKISPRPVFVIHSIGDDYIDISHGREIYESAKKPKESWFPDCPKHVREHVCNEKRAEAKVTGFFLKHL